MSTSRDLPSFSEPSEVRVTHCSLELTASFDKETLSGGAVLHLERSNRTAPLILDTRDLQVEAVLCNNTEVPFELGAADPILGNALNIELPSDADSVLIRYSSQPHASGLQWLTPQQTAGKRHPFLFSQNQSIHARSWIPIQDSPGVRITYDARIKAAPDLKKPLKVLMSAEPTGFRDGFHTFEMSRPIPPYLIALAIGDLDFSAIGARSGVWAEPSVLASARREFSDAERLIETVERLYGPYLWGRYDLLILPPSFPFGGMENPCLTFVTPTILAGDKSLVGLVSHELAHSWSGNLVTNATWSDFWLNEGFTTYIENRIQEEVYGREQALMEQVLDHREIEKELSEFSPRDQVLHIDLRGRDPDEGTTRVPYIKGALVLRQMEQAFGRTVFDEFLKKYFNRFAFQSITTEQALDYLKEELFACHPERARQIPLEQWVFAPGLPESAPQARSKRLERVASFASEWHAGKLAADQIDTKDWRSQEWIEFLQVLPRPLPKERMAELDRAFYFTATGNCEVLDEWLLAAIESRYLPAHPRLAQFLSEVGRVRYIKPLYIELMKTEEGRTLAQEIYAKARPGYHPIAQTAIDKIVESDRYFSSEKLPANSASIPEE